MDDYISLVNSGILNLFVGVILLLVTIVCIIFLRKG